MHKDIYTTLINGVILATEGKIFLEEPKQFNKPNKEACIYPDNMHRLIVHNNLSLEDKNSIINDVDLARKIIQLNGIQFFVSGSDIVSLTPIDKNNLTLFISSVKQIVTDNKAALDKIKEEINLAKLKDLLTSVITKKKKEDIISLEKDIHISRSAIEGAQRSLHEEYFRLESNLKLIDGLNKELDNNVYFVSDKITKISKIKDIHSIDIAEEGIVKINTNEIIIPFEGKKYSLGRICLKINFVKLFNNIKRPQDSVSVERPIDLNKDLLEHRRYPSFTHPHYASFACLGNAAAIISDFAAQADLVGIIGILIAHLNSYNHQDAFTGQHIVEWPLVNLNTIECWKSKELNKKEFEQFLTGNEYITVDELNYVLTNGITSELQNKIEEKLIKTSRKTILKCMDWMMHDCISCNIHSTQKEGCTSFIDYAKKWWNCGHCTTKICNGGSCFVPPLFGTRYESILSLLTGP